MADKILLATNNLHKVDEIKKIMSEYSDFIVSLKSFEKFPVPVEDEDTYRENALIKALHYHRLTSLPTLADDSGIEIDAFDGRPGIHSARFIDPDLSYEERNRKVLEMMKGVPDEKRGARFVCCCVLVAGADNIFTKYGRLEGAIGRELKGGHGFGYDPIFLMPERGVHLAEIEPEEKNRISHRARAFENMKKNVGNVIEQIR